MDDSLVTEFARRKGERPEPGQAHLRPWTRHNLREMMEEMGPEEFTALCLLIDAGRWSLERDGMGAVDPALQSLARDGYGVDLAQHATYVRVASLVKNLHYEIIEQGLM